MLNQPILIGLYAVINLFAFVMIAKDKAQSMQRGVERVPEGQLYFIASFFGAAGVYAGMLLFRHKTRKWYFVFGIPLLILENAATLYLINMYVVMPA